VATPIASHPVDRAQDRPVAVFGLLHAGLAVVRSLGRAGIPVAGIALSRHEFGLRSRYLRRRFLLSGDAGARDRELLSALREIGGGRRIVLVPEGDPNVELLLRNWEAVRELADLPLPDDADAVRRLGRKDLLLAEAARAGIPVPATALARSEEDVRVSGLQPPVLVKPVTGEEFGRTFAQKVFVANDQDKVLEAWRRAQAHGFATVLQELVPGADGNVFSLFTYVGRSGRPLASVVGRKVREAPLHFGTSSVFQVEPCAEVLEPGLALLARVGFRGFAHVEFVRDLRDGGFKLLEVNTRIPVWAGIAMNRHLDMARIAYEDLCGHEPPAPRTLERQLTWIYLAKDMWVALQLARRGELRPRELLASYARRDKVRALLASDDLGPLIASFRYMRLQARRYLVPSAFSQTSGTPDRR
jgi:predicted ATP-grasp superfamily ATP-dependent carboligase